MLLYEIDIALSATEVPRAMEIVLLPKPKSN